jgi:pilus assembly protein CpaB
MATSASALPALGGELSLRRRRLFVLGIALAAGAFLLTFALGLVLFERGQAAASDVTVVVASRDIAPRQQLQSNMLTLTHYPARLVPAGALSTVDAAAGKFSQVAIAKNQPLTMTLLASSPEVISPSSSEYLPIAQGYVALTIPTSEEQGVGGYIAPGDYIDVIATVNTALFGPTNGKQVSKTVLKNLHVIRVGAAVSDRQGSRGPGATSLTVVMNSCDAEMLNWLALNATLKYELRSYKDYAPPAIAPDPACPAPGGAGGVGPAQVDSRFGFTKV